METSNFLDEYRTPLIKFISIVSLLQFLLFAWGAYSGRFPTWPTWGIVIPVILQVVAVVIAFIFAAQSTKLAGRLMFGVGLLIILIGSTSLYPEGFSLQNFIADFYANASTELISIAITILIIDAINERRTKEHDLENLKWEMGSQDNLVAISAIQKLRGRKWLMDGTLKGIDLRDADLQNARLFLANLTDADMQGTNLENADLEDAILTNANVTIEQLAQAKALAGATMPDGRKYEEWEPLILERPPAPLTIEQPEPENGKDSRFLLLLTGAGIAVFSSILSFWLHGKWGKQ